MNDIFKGIKIVELATFVAAPAAARFFADLGAEVIKVEAPSGDAIRFAARNEGRPEGEEENTTFDLENANKKAIVLNLKSKAGSEAMLKLVAEADVFITNLRPSALMRNGLDYETLKQMFPKLVFACITGFGEKGPDKDLPGYDYTAFFARGGILGTLYEKGTTPMNLIPGFGDHQAGMYLAAGIAAALYRVKTTGKGEKVSVSLLHSALYGIGLMLQASQYGHSATQYPISRRDAPNPFLMSYKTKDERFIQIAVPAFDPFYERVMKALGLEKYSGDKRYCTQEALTENLHEFYDIISSAFESKTMAEWTDILTAADLPFSPAKLWPEILEDKQAWGSDCLYKMEYSNGNLRTLVRPPVLFEESGLPDYNRGPYLGEQTADILRSLGYSEAEIKAMLEAKDAVQHQ